MNHTFSKITALFLTALALSPAFAIAATPASATTQFSKEGIFGCSRNAAALSNSVGGFSARGGVYVPVADYTVELNTGTLVYQQCVLRGIMNRISDSAASSLIKKELGAVNGGNGSPRLYVTNPAQEQLDYGSDPVVLRVLQSRTLDAADPSIAPVIKQAYARFYQTQTRNAQNSLTCPMSNTSAKNFIQSGGRVVDNGTFWTNVIALSYGSCNPLGAFEETKTLIRGRVAARLGELKNELDRGDGYYSVTHIDENGNRIIDTPSSVVRDSTQLAIDAGFMKTLNANDVDQMVGALFAGLSAQILSGPGGLSGITEPIGSQPSYLSQLAAESSAGLRNAISNAATVNINAALAIENAYNQVMNAIGQKLTNTIAQLRGAENQC